MHTTKGDSKRGLTMAPALAASEESLGVNEPREVSSTPKKAKKGRRRCRDEESSDCSVASSLDDMDLPGAIAVGGRQANSTATVSADDDSTTHPPEPPRLQQRQRDESLIVAEIVEQDKPVDAVLVQEEDKGDDREYRKKVRLLISCLLLVVVILIVVVVVSVVLVTKNNDPLELNAEGTIPIINETSVPTMSPTTPNPATSNPTTHQPSSTTPSTSPTSSPTTSPTTRPTTRPTANPTTLAPTNFPTPSFRRRVWFPRGEAIDHPEPKAGLGQAVALSCDGTIVAATVSGLSQVQVFQFTGGSRWVPKGSPISYATEWFGGRALDMDRTGNIVVVGDPYPHYNGELPGRAAVYRFNETLEEWTPMGEPMVGVFANDHFGESVGLSANGKRVVVGAPREHLGTSSGPGFIRVYEFDELSSLWMSLQFDGVESSELTGGLGFGAAVDISADGTHIIVGAPRTGMTGLAHVYKWNESISSWKEAFPAVNGDGSLVGIGSAVAIADSGNVFVAGTGENSGDALIYRNTEGEDAIEDDPQWDIYTIRGDRLGTFNDPAVVDITWDGKSVAIGVPDGPQAVRLFRFDAFEYNYMIQGQALTSVFPGDNDDFGAAIALDDNGRFLAVGAPIFWWLCEDAGRVAVFELQ